MDESELLPLAIAGPNENSIIGYYTVKNSDTGLQLVGNDVRVNMSITFNNRNFELINETEIPLELFQALKDGGQSASVQLIPFEKPAPVEQQTLATSLAVTKVEPILAETKVPEPILICDEPTPPAIDYSEPKRKSVFNTRLGTSGKKKFIRAENGGVIPVEVSWVDIVELAHENLPNGSNSSLKEIYKWAAKNVYTNMNGRNCSIKNLNNWEASIRQNRRKAKNYVKQPSKYDVQNLVENDQPKYDEPNTMNATEINAELNSVDGFVDVESPLEFDPNLNMAENIEKIEGSIKSFAEDFERSKIPMVPKIHTPEILSTSGPYVLPISTRPCVEFGIHFAS